MKALTSKERHEAGALCVITSYFNWAHFQSKRLNYEAFRLHMKQSDISVLTVECALIGDPFDLIPARDVIQVRTNSIMWQKERLLNIALDSLSSDYRFVAWIDCDVLFQNPRWHLEAVRQMENVGVIQLFSEVIRLPRCTSPTMIDPTLARPGFVSSLRDSVVDHLPATLGHPGFAWAVRRDVIEACNGFYDACIIGGADCVMAHAWFGDYGAYPVRQIAAGHIESHYQIWAERAHRVVRGSVSSIAGQLLHLWHGEDLNRIYRDRHKIMSAFGFDPDQDLCLNMCGCWEWSGRKPEMERWMESYFEGRREDG